MTRLSALIAILCLLVGFYAGSLYGKRQPRSMAPQAVPTAAPCQGVRCRVWRDA